MKLVTEYSYFDGKKTVSFYESRPHISPDVAISVALGFVTSCGRYTDKPNFTMATKFVND